MMAPSTHPVVRIFKGLVVFLLGMLVAELIWFGVSDRLLAVNDQHLSMDYNVEPADITPAPPLDTFNETVSRSLFNWNRKPKAVVQKVVSDEGLETRWQLSGVVNTGNAIYALFSESDGSRRLRLEQGMYLEKWKLDSITPEKVVLKNNESEEVFYLKETSPPKLAPKIRPKKRVGNIKNNAAKTENKDTD